MEKKLIEEKPLSQRCKEVREKIRQAEVNKKRLQEGKEGEKKDESN